MSGYVLSQQVNFRLPPVTLFLANKLDSLFPLRIAPCPNVFGNIFGNNLFSYGSFLQVYSYRFIFCSKNHFLA